MKTLKYLLRPAALSLLWLCVGLGCKKEETLCESVGCCMPRVEARIAAVLNGVLIDPLKLNTPFIIVRDEVYDKVPFNGKPSRIGLLTMCSGDEEKLDAFVREQQLQPNYNPQQVYRLWGWVYDAVWIIPFIPTPQYAVKIDRIEKMP
jgi:hypothetical protein